LQENVPKQEYSREDVRRMLGVSEQQLRGWERQGLIRDPAVFSFKDLIALRTLLKLRENRISTQMIGRAVASLKRKIAGVEHPLSELRIVPEGRHMAVHVAGQKMEPISGQILFDFESVAPAGIKAFPAEAPVNRASVEREAEFWFQRGLELEERGAPVEETIEAYQKSVGFNPHAAGAWVNLGTIHFRLRKYREAEDFYLRAIEADPAYPLAQFNLGNLYDEQCRLDKAEEFYKNALKLNPQYADAHFNLALLCERRGETLKAVHHWKSYLKIDPASSWSTVARRQLDKLRDATLIRSQ
jgi:DNA-binding transcriptional MerR regulator